MKYSFIRKVTFFIFLPLCFNVLQIVFTKVDLTSKQELYTSLGQAFSVINSSMGGACLPFIPTLSTVDKTGLDHFKLTMGEIYGQKWDF